MQTPYITKLLYLFICFPSQKTPVAVRNVHVSFLMCCSCVFFPPTIFPLMCMLCINTKSHLHHLMHTEVVLLVDTGTHMHDMFLHFHSHALVLTCAHSLTVSAHMDPDILIHSFYSTLAQWHPIVRIRGVSPASLHLNYSSTLDACTACIPRQA